MNIFIRYLILISLFVPLHIDAFGGVGIKPQTPSNLAHKSWFMYSISPGESLNDTFLLINTSNETKHVITYPADAVPTGGEGLSIAQKDMYMSGVGRWIDMHTSVFEISPLGKIEVPFSLHFPVDGPVGESCGGLVVQEIKTDVSKKNLQLGTRNAARVYINYEDGNCDGSFSEICHYRTYPYEYLQHTEKEYYDIIAPTVVKVAQSTLDDHFAHGDVLYDGIPCPKGPEPPDRRPSSKSLSPTHFVIKAIPEKRVNPENNHAIKGDLTFFNSSGKYEFSIDLDKSGQGYLSPTLKPGDYSVGFKGLSHLTKVIHNVGVKESATINLDFTDNNRFELLAGDVAPSKDDYVNSLDIVATTQVLYQDNVHADLNKDGIVNAMDLSIEIKNLHKSGEKIN